MSDINPAEILQHFDLANPLNLNSVCYNDGAAERRATLHRKTERRRLNVKNLNVEGST